MLFNSYAFLFVFLPVTLLGFQIAGRFHRRAVVAWLVVASLCFYGYWYPPFVLVLLTSIAFNYVIAVLISRRIRNAVPTQVWLWTAIAANLSALGYFKYLVPVLTFVTGVSGAGHEWAHIALPLGISFFTFTQIAYLIDLQQGVAEQQDPLSYLLFVTFFPHLIAGPILHHKEMMPQFRRETRYRLRAPDVAVGLTWFVMGLGKKVIIADSFALYANAAYKAPGHLTASAAWEGALAYSLQLYFDFSGYSDMALGLARMFSIHFPLNFDSPYKAASVTEYWQRWHITLSTYIMDYLYSPIQFGVRGRRRAKGKAVNRAALMSAQGFTVMIALPMIVTMWIAGVWHGAGLQFMVFGLLHGLYLTVNHAWRLWGPQPAAKTAPRPPLVKAGRHAFAVLLTYLSVLVGSVFFRADSVSDAVWMLANMMHIHTAGGHFVLVEDNAAKQLHAFAKLAVGYGIVWFLPNTQEILRNFKPSLQADLVEQVKGPRWMTWSPNFIWGVLVTAVAIASIFNLQNVSTFLYFQF